MGGRYVRQIYCQKSRDLALNINEELAKIEEDSRLVDIKLFRDEQDRQCALLILEKL